MRDFNNIAIYIIFILSVYFQSYINIYDKFIEYKTRVKYYNQLEFIEQIKIHTDEHTHTNNKISHEPKVNYYIPKQAQFVREYFRRSPINSFRLSPLIVDVYNRYAIIEGAYPIRVSDKSHYLVTTNEDILDHSCNVLDSKEGIRIVYCP